MSILNMCPHTTDYESEYYICGWVLTLLTMRYYFEIYDSAPKSVSLRVLLRYIKKIKAYDML